MVSAWANCPRVLDGESDADAMWGAAYGHLMGMRPGMFGEATSPAEAQVLRLSVLCAALDCSDLIRAEHLLGALAVWRYCEVSAR